MLRLETILKEKRKVLDKGATLLLEREKIDGKELKALMAQTMKVT